VGGGIKRWGKGARRPEEKRPFIQERETGEEMTISLWKVINLPIFKEKEATFSCYTRRKRLQCLRKEGAGVTLGGRAMTLKKRREYFVGGRERFIIEKGEKGIWVQVPLRGKKGGWFLR